MPKQKSYSKPKKITPRITKFFKPIPKPKMNKSAT